MYKEQITLKLLRLVKMYRSRDLTPVIFAFLSLPKSENKRFAIEKQSFKPLLGLMEESF